MATNTTNYSLVKPGIDDFYDVEVNNGNMEAIDLALKGLSDSIGSIDSDSITLPDGSTVSEKITSITTQIGNLEEIDTTTKTSLVAAINELKNEVSTHLADDTKHVTPENRTYWDNKQDQLETNKTRSIFVDNVEPTNEIGMDGDIWIVYEE